jgi:sRNA-binding carbon storage regulator CsrA
MLITSRRVDQGISIEDFDLTIASIVNAPEIWAELDEEVSPGIWVKIDGPSVPFRIRGSDFLPEDMPLAYFKVGSSIQLGEKFGVNVEFQSVGTKNVRLAIEGVGKGTVGYF